MSQQTHKVLEPTLGPPELSYLELQDTVLTHEPSLQPRSRFLCFWYDDGGKNSPEGEISSPKAVLSKLRFLRDKLTERGESPPAVVHGKPALVSHLHSSWKTFLATPTTSDHAHNNNNTPTHIPMRGKRGKMNC